MAYLGYRLKIDGTILKNRDIAKGTFTLGKNPRVAKEWTDIQRIKHKTFFPTDKTVISFSIREHLASDHSNLASYFAARNVTVEFYDDNSETYITKDFEVLDFDWSHSNTNPLFYNATPITLEEW